MNLKINLAVTLLICGLSASAQQDLMLHSLPGVAQSLYVNPSRAPHAGVHIGLPFMSSVSVSHHNSIFNPGRLFENTEGRVEFQTDDFLNDIKDKNDFGLDLSTDILSFGMPVKNHYFSFAIREKVDATLTLPGDLLRFPFTGNGDFEATGGSLDFTDLAVELNHYVEYGLGWQTKLKDRFYVGARVKFLFGKENITTKGNSLNWKTDPTTFAWSYQGDMEVNTSGVDVLLDSIDGNALLENGKIGQYLLSSPNFGLGMDLGFGVQVNERWDLNMSLIDLGYINWKSNNKNYKGVGNDFAFAGLEVTEAFISQDASFSDSLDAAIEDISSALEESFSVESNTDKYTSSLKTRMYASVGYRVFKKAKSSGKATFLMQSDFQNGVSFPSLSLIYTHSLRNKVGISTSYSIMDNDFLNLGMGLSLKGGPVVFYATMDNFLWLSMDKVKWSAVGESVTYPSVSRNASLHFGMNILMAKNSKTSKAKPRLD